MVKKILTILYCSWLSTALERRYYGALDIARYHHRVSWMSGIRIDGLTWFWEENERELLMYQNHLQMRLGEYMNL